MKLSLFPSAISSLEMGRKRYYCSHCDDFVSRVTRSRHLKQIVERSESASETESDSISDVETSSEVHCLETRDSFEDRGECFRADLASGGDCGDIGDSVSEAEGETYRLWLTCSGGSKGFLTAHISWKQLKDYMLTFLAL